MTGGGSGGHITPILAVANEIRQRDSSAEVVYVGQRGDVFGEVVAENTLIAETHTVYAGKFRRYHGLGMSQLLDYETIWLNLRDTFRVTLGTIQAIALLRRIRPDVVFCKGGFVGVPIGLAAAFWRIPYVTHDSDAIPGLANRIISRWARCHAVALDASLYPYPTDKTVSVGVPTNATYEMVDEATKLAYRKAIGLSGFKHVLLVTGGGLGAVRLNEAIMQHARQILEAVPSLCIIHTTGQLHEAEASATYTKVLTKAQRRQVIVRGFVTNLYEYSGAADVVVARGGATNFAEFALQAKPCIIVPNPMLTGGHQLKNALAYEQKNAIICVQEADIAKDSSVLAQAVIALLHNREKQRSLAKAIHSFAHSDATSRLADIILDIGSSSDGKVA